MDHVVPRSKGGNATEHNLMPAHGRCNRERGCSDPPPGAVHPLAMVKPPRGPGRKPPASTDEAIATQKRDEESLGAPRP